MLVTETGNFPFKTFVLLSFNLQIDCLRWKEANFNWIPNTPLIISIFSFFPVPLRLEIEIFSGSFTDRTQFETMVDLNHKSSAIQQKRKAKEKGSSFGWQVTMWIIWLWSHNAEWTKDRGQYWKNRGQPTSFIVPFWSTPSTNERNLVVNENILFNIYVKHWISFGITTTTFTTFTSSFQTTWPWFEIGTIAEWFQQQIKGDGDFLINGWLTWSRCLFWSWHGTPPHFTQT